MIAVNVTLANNLTTVENSVGVNFGVGMCGGDYIVLILFEIE